LVNLIILFKPHTCIIRKLLLQLSNKEINKNTWNKSWQTRDI
jgi:hypothetical protein